jgi:dUTP pyrophosphatase
MERVLIKKLTNDAKIPTRGSKDSAGYDLHAAIDNYVQINPHTSVKIGTGIAMAIPDGYYGAIHARSGLATKEGLRLANCVGIIDSDYRGEIMLAMYNDHDTPRFVRPGERLAQIIFQKYEPVNFEEVLQLPTTIRGDGGFGSTGKE